MWEFRLFIKYWFLIFYLSRSLASHISYLFTKSSKKQDLVSFAEIVKEPKYWTTKAQRTQRRIHKAYFKNSAFVKTLCVLCIFVVQFFFYNRLVVLLKSTIFLISINEKIENYVTIQPNSKFFVKLQIQNQIQKASVLYVPAILKLIWSVFIKKSVFINV